jgi:retron-type reverse transcriptase
VFENYRPISVLTGFSKLLEKIIHKRLISYKHQYGFRKNRSTEHAIIELTDKISNAI